MLDVARIETHYAKSGDLNIAYQLFGDGEHRIVYIPGWASNVEHLWSFPQYAEFGSKLARFARVVVLDRRGTGLSDPVSDPPTIEERMDDVRAVMDAAGWESANIWGVSEGGPMAIVFAATYPARMQSLLLYGTFARLVRDASYPAGIPAAAFDAWLSTIAPLWGKGEMSKVFTPSRVGDAEFVRAMGKLERMAMSPGTAHKLFRNLGETDVRDVLPSVRVPTLVTHRAGDRAIVVGHARYLAEHIAGARYVELPGDEHVPFMDDQDTLLDEVREFLTGERPAPEADRVLTTILFCDIADSTGRAAALGDHAWSALLARFYAIADERLRAQRGRKLDTAGDGLFAAFDGPARAVRCGLALCAAMAALGVRVRVGVHTGECEVLGEKYSGIAVHVGARVAAVAEPGQVVVSSTVKDLVVGSGIVFEALGERELKGVPERWRIYRAVA
jgi:pimeloyl-ACP methyl ester carboxylesterase